MKILLSLLSGLSRSFRIRKWILMVWFVTLVLVSLFSFPVKTGIKSILGPSLIEEKLAEGNFTDVIANDGFDIKTVFPVFFSGLFLVIIAGSVLNIFFAGGFYNVIKDDVRKSKAADFLGGAGSNFWSFLVISVITFSVLFFLTLITAGIPAIIAAAGDSDFTVMRTIRRAGVILLILSPLAILPADYARAWQVTSSEKNAFRAYGKGIKMMFGSFFVSYISAALVLIINLLFSLLALKTILYLKSSGSGTLLLIILFGQFLAIIKIFLRVWRYGVVTSLYESYSRIPETDRMT